MARTLLALRRPEGVERRPRPSSHPPGLHLDEDERAAVVHDEVELAVSGAVIAVDDGEPQALEMLERELLSQAAQVLAAVGGHGPEARHGGVQGQHASVTTSRDDRPRRVVSRRASPATGRSVASPPCSSD
jgi:hypothetical protein